MADDYLSALNVGSGLNTTQIIDAMVAAERDPKAKLINDRKSDRTVSISSLSTIKTTVSTFDTTLSGLDGTTGLTAAQSGTSATVAITDSSLAAAFSHELEITSLAAAQTLVFDGYSAASAELGAGSLVFNFGTWSNGSFTANSDRTSSTVTIADGSDSIEEVAASINAAGIDVTASVLMLSDNNYALVLRSITGADNAMQITASETVNGSGVADLGYTSTDANIETVAATDAVFTLDGASITRDNNIVTDLIDGVTLTLASTTSSAETVSASYDSTTAYTALSNMITEMNTLQSLLRTQSQRALNGATAGPLAGDPLIQSMISDLRNMTTTAISGFGDSNIYLANFGVETARDGSLSIDLTDFNAAFDADPDSFAAIMNSRVTTGSSLVSARMLGDDYTPGVYEFAISESGVTIDGDSMTLSDAEYSVSSGNADGLVVKLSGAGTDTSVYIGTSLLDSLRSFADTILDADNEIDDRITNYRSDLLDYEDELTALDSRITDVRKRYVDQFAKMDQAVASMKRTGEALTNMMDSWKASQSQ